MAGQSIEYPSNGNTATGYLSLPETGSGPGVIVIQEWWGLVPHIEDVADRFAAEGYVALAPDLYHGQSTTEPDEAQKYMMELRMDEAVQDMTGAVGFLRNHEAVDPSKIGCVGFCMGGGLTLYLASTGQIDAAVPFYGVPSFAPDDWGQTACPILGHYAEHDGATDMLPDLQASLEAAGVDAAFHVYPGTNHAFFNDDRPEIYDEPASKLAWERTLEFFSDNLR